jgi:hypothetical protein
LQTAIGIILIVVWPLIPISAIFSVVLCLGGVVF